MDRPVAQGNCKICVKRTAIYTCPRCATRTCSLTCSRSHKTLQSCSGERDKAAYVPMNKYGWGTMANDYAYMEEVGRKVVEWGNVIMKGGFLASAASAARGLGRGRGRGRGMSRGQSKRDILKMQLCAQDIDVETLPPGMEKRRLNQSTWDVRRKVLLMTLELVFHSARDPLSPSSAPDPSSLRILAHRNDVNCTLLDIVRKHVVERANKAGLPSWVRCLTSEGGDEDWTTTLYLMAQHNVSSPHHVPKTYFKLDARQPLALCLRHKSFVEYPTIDVWEDGAFASAFVETDGTFVESEYTPPAKRRRLDTVGGRKVIKSLLGGYTSDEEEGAENNVLSMLDNYGSEESEVESSHVLEQDRVGEGDCVKGDSVEDDNVEEPTLEDLHDVLEAVGHDASLVEDQIPWPDDEVGWGDSSEDEGDALERALKRRIVE